MFYCQCALNARVEPTLLAPPPEPDVAVVPGSVSDYDHRHPTAALLVVEVADSSLAQDRVTKRALYAAAGVREYWIVNLRDDRVEIFRAPEPESRRFGETRIGRRGERLSLVAFPDVTVAVDDLLPAH
jgi:Uma2 family endonuclease